MTNTFLKAVIALGTTYKRSEYAVYLLICLQWANTTSVVVSTLICRYIRRENDNLLGYNRRISNRLCHGHGMMSTFRKTTQKCSARPQSKLFTYGHDVYQLGCPQRGHQTLEAVSLFFKCFVHRIDEDFKSHNRRVLTNYAMDKG